MTLISVATRLNRLAISAKRSLQPISSSSFSSFSSFSSSASASSFSHVHLRSTAVDVDKKIELPSSMTLKLPIQDFKIIDNLKRVELTLPEIAKHKVVDDPLSFLDPTFRKIIEEPTANANENNNNKQIECGNCLNSERKWRSRYMNKKKKAKYEKKMFYVIQRRNQAKAKRYNGLLKMYTDIHEKKSELYSPLAFVNRELEKARFYGYKATPVYDELRDQVNNTMQTFDEKLTRKFEDTKRPYHVLYNEEISRVEKIKKND